MKRTIRVLVAMCLVVLLVLLSAGTALAASPLIVGTNSGEQINGTSNAEEIRGLEGSDEISDGLGADSVYGGIGGDNLIGTASDTSVDRFYGGSGEDIFQPRDVPAVKDMVSCGPGTDTVYADKADVVGGDCEQVEAW
jgi:Ca2+-binding RTX toxin-like protein